MTKHAYKCFKLRSSVLVFLKHVKSMVLIYILMLIGLAPAFAEQSIKTPNYIDRVYDIILNVPDGEQDQPIEQLLEEMLSYRRDNSESVETWIACALAHLVYGGDRTNFLVQRQFFKTTRMEIETAIKLDKLALNGLATAYLGRLYHLMPPWPISFGNNKKAEKLLVEALQINPDAAPNNLYYALFLISKNKHQAAKPYLLKAKAALPRKNLPHWDVLLLRDINKAIADIDSNLD